MINAIRWPRGSGTFSQLTPWHIPAGGRHKKRRRTVCGIQVRERAPVISATVPQVKVCGACRRVPVNFVGKATGESGITSAQIADALERFQKKGGSIQREETTPTPLRSNRVGDDVSLVGNRRELLCF